MHATLFVESRLQAWTRDELRAITMCDESWVLHA